jgi:RNA polymerase subunit RPABC4/transcription elongation factor Spt4
MNDPGFEQAQAAYEHAEPRDEHCPVCEDQRQVRIHWDGIVYREDDDKAQAIYFDIDQPDIFISCPECQGVKDTYICK